MTVMTPDQQRRLSEAFQFALRSHAALPRKGGEIPYASHLLQVCGLVLEHGGTIEQAMAGLLHDVVEDCAEISIEDLRESFGPDVAQLVADCTDTLPGEDPQHKRPWKVRKTAYLAHVETIADTSLLVSACDKRHNLGTMVRDAELHGLTFFDRFHAGASEQLWYYQGFLRVARGRLPRLLEDELAVLVDRLRGLVERG